MIPAPFDYHAPKSIGDAIKLLGDLGPDAKLLAGGHSLFDITLARQATDLDAGAVREGGTHGSQSIAAVRSGICSAASL